MFFQKFIEYIGDRVIKHSLFTYDFIIFLLLCLWNIVLLRNYGKSSRIFFIKQIYLSAIKNLFSFIFLALFFGSILIVIAINFSIKFNLLGQIGDLLVLLLINEFSPFFTSLFFIFVYSLSIQDERSKSKEVEKKKSLNKLTSKLYIPQLLTGLIIVPLMSLLFASIMIVSGYIVSSLYLKIDFLTYNDLIINSISFENILILLIKSSIFGFICVLVPLYSKYKKKKNYDIIGLVIKNLIIILSMLILVELLFILVVY